MDTFWHWFRDAFAGSDITALANLFSLIAFIMALRLWLYQRIKARRTHKQIFHSKTVLEPALQSSTEYQGLLKARRTYRGYGIICLLLLLVLIIGYGTLFLFTRTFPILQWNYLVPAISLLGSGLLDLYLGYAPISLQEVEQKRQAKRSRAMREAQGKLPYRYLLRHILFPICFWTWISSCIYSLNLMIHTPVLLPLHLPPQWIILITVALFLVFLWITYLQGRDIYKAIKGIKDIPRTRREWLRQQLQSSELHK